MIRLFPMATADYSDDFNAQTHHGNDLFAPEGAPVFAVDDGSLRLTEDPIGGHVFYLHAPDGTVYYGAHLSAYEGADRSVRAGDVIGYVGHTGNAAHTQPHLHFEVHPGGGAAVDPFSLLAPYRPTGSHRAPWDTGGPIASRQAAPAMTTGEKFVVAASAATIVAAGAFVWRHRPRGTRRRRRVAYA